MKWPTRLSCRQLIVPTLIAECLRCYRFRWHLGAHRDRNGDTWEGKR